MSEAKHERSPGKLPVVRRPDRVYVGLDDCSYLPILPLGGGPKRPRARGPRQGGRNCRIRIAYVEEGDARRIVAVEKLATRATGVFVGEVMFVVNDFWIAVKPKNGPPDAFALGQDPRKGGPIVDLLKSLKKGDVVAVKYNTDFERHRIVQLEKK